MKINNRIILVLCIVASILLVTVALICQAFVFSTIEQIEQDQATADMQLVLSRLNGEVEDTAAVCRNWAGSGEMNRFVRENSTGTGGVGVYRDTRVDYVLYYNSSGMLVYSLAPAARTTDDLHELNAIVRNSILPQGISEGIAGRRGYAMVGDRAVILAGYPVAPPAETGDAKGTLVMARLLDEGRISELAQQNDLEISLDRVQAGDGTDPSARKMDGGAILVSIVNESELRSSTYITSIENTPTRIRITVNTPRLLYQRVMAAAGYISAAIIILTLVLLLAIRWPLKRCIVNPIVTLDRNLKTIGESGDISRPVDTGGDDEIRSLAGSLNRMLGEIHSAQNRLLESETRFRALAETSVAGIFVFRSKNLYANPAAELQTGYSRQELAEMDFWEFIHPDFQEIVRERWEKRQNGEDVPVRIEFKIVTKSGEERWIDASTTGFIYEGELASFSVRIDITQRKEAEKELRSSEEKFRALTENTPDIIFSMDDGDAITYISPQIERYGISAGDLIGTPVMALVFPDDRHLVMQNFRTAKESGHADATPFRILGRGQNLHWLEVNSTVILDSSGTCTGLQGMMRDITERRRALDALTLANKKLNLMYDITRHDILNKITILFGLIDMTNATDSAADRQQYLDEIRNAGQAIYNQIILTRDYQEVGIQSPRWNSMDEVIRRAVSGLSGNGIRVKISVGSLEIYADPLIEKVIYNLADNAIRYGNTITTIRFFTGRSASGLELICEDDGVGIGAGEKERIFERGFGKNTGLGLFLAREILTITGISITENGEPGAGARFVLFLPKGTFRCSARHDENDRQSQ